MVRAVDWPCELLDRVRWLWDQGLTATEISERVNKSRSAIMGKLSRARNQGAAIHTRTTVNPKPKKMHKPKKSVASPVAREATDGSGKQQQSVPPLAVASPPPVLDPITEHKGWVGVVAAISAIQTRQCRWPLGDPVSGFCRAHLDSIYAVYCDYHAEMSRPKNGKRAGE